MRIERKFMHEFELCARFMAEVCNLTQFKKKRQKITFACTKKSKAFSFATKSCLLSTKGKKLFLSKSRHLPAPFLQWKEIADL